MLSVIVPFYDETIYLRNALNSIIDQRIDGLQIIVVNDNPEVFSGADMAALGVSGDIDLIQHPRNLGLSAARNSGLAQARGKYIGFLDSDDFYTLGGLAHQLKSAQDSGADITHAQTYFTHLGSSAARILPRDAAYFATPRTANGLKHAEEAQFIASSWSSLYDRAFLTRNNLSFDTAQTRFEDRLFVLHTITQAEKIAFTGQPNRVWRGRAGSISVTATTPETHLLQLQLLEKCQSHMRARVAAGHLKLQHEKRELFNTVSRLIWDLDLIDAINRADDPAYQDMAARIPALLGDARFGHAIFDDPILKPINRIGMVTRKGRISRESFFAIHRTLREGDFAGAHHLIHQNAPAPTPARRRAIKPTRKRLILHLGMHKTGSTFLQHHLTGHRELLLQQGILVPLSGLEIGGATARTGATPGHQGLVRALRANDPVPWQYLQKEIQRSKAHTVVISCENMLFPTVSNRDEMIDLLADQLGSFYGVDLIALSRRADRYIEASYRERLSIGARQSDTGIGGYLADHAGLLTNLPALFAPLERRFATQVRLGDFDALVRDNTLWPGFCALAGLPPDLPELPVAHYQTPDRNTMQILHLLNTLVADAGLRSDILKAWFALHPAPVGDSSLLSPQTRLGLIDQWQAQSADFARERGLDPDLDAARAALSVEDWHPPDALPLRHVQDLIAIANQAAPALFATDAPHNSGPPRRAPRPPGDLYLTIRLRPWAANVLRNIRQRLGQNRG